MRIVLMPLTGRELILMRISDGLNDRNATWPGADRRIDAFFVANRFPQALILAPRVEERVLVQRVLRIP